MNQVCEWAPTTALKRMIAPIPRTTRSDPVADRPRPPPGLEPGARQQQEDHRERVDRDQHRELAADSGRDETGRGGADRPPARPHGERLPDEEEAQGGPRVCGRLLDQERGVRERRGRDRADRREQRPRLREDRPREEVGREERGRHHEHPDVLDRRVGGGDVADLPERREQIGVQRLEPGRMAAELAVACLRDRARDLRELQLVREQPRRHVPAGLPAVQDDEQEIGDRERKRLVEPVGLASLVHGAQHDQRVEIGLSPDESAGDVGGLAGADDRRPAGRRGRSGSSPARCPAGRRRWRARCHACHRRR